VRWGKLQRKEAEPESGDTGGGVTPVYTVSLGFDVNLRGGKGEKKADRQTRSREKQARTRGQLFRKVEWGDLEEWPGALLIQLHISEKT